MVFVDDGVEGHDRRWNRESRVQHGSSTGIKGLVAVTINYEKQRESNNAKSHNNLQRSVGVQVVV